MEIPRTLSAPAIGETITFLTLPEESGNEYLRFELTAKPNVRGPPTHYHPTATEQFEIRAGSLYLTVDGEEHVLGPGDSLVVPARTPHSFRVGPEGVRGIGTVSPPGRFTEFLVSEFALMDAGHLGSGTDGNLLAIAPWIREFRDVSRPVGPIRLLLDVLAPVGRVLGYPSMPAYSTDEMTKEVAI